MAGRAGEARGTPGRGVGERDEASGAGVRMEVYGEEIVERRVCRTNKVGRVYLPLEWVGKRIKVIRVA